MTSKFLCNHKNLKTIKWLSKLYVNIKIIKLVSK